MTEYLSSDELGKALTKLGYMQVHAQGIMDEIKTMRAKAKHPEAFTLGLEMGFSEQEVKDAWTRLVNGGSFLPEHLIADMRKHRDPEFKAGEVYKDAGGQIWKRAPHGGWFKMGATGLHSETYPVRPLKLMKVQDDG